MEQVKEEMWSLQYRKIRTLVWGGSGFVGSLSQVKYLDTALVERHETGNACGWLRGNFIEPVDLDEFKQLTAKDNLPVNKSFSTVVLPLY